MNSIFQILVTSGFCSTFDDEEANGKDGSQTFDINFLSSSSQGADMIEATSTDESAARRDKLLRSMSCKSTTVPSKYTVRSLDNPSFESTNGVTLADFHHNSIDSYNQGN